MPVLAGEVRELLAVRPGDTVVDCTFGAGGHARLLPATSAAGPLRRHRPRPDARPTSRRCARARPGVELRALRGSFALCLRNLLATGVRADAVLMDLGISSMQVDRPSGASRTPRRAARHAHGPVRRAHRRRHGQRVRRARARRRSCGASARSATRARSRGRSSGARAEAPFTRTFELVETIKKAIPTPSRFGQGHPAKRSSRRCASPSTTSSASSRTASSGRSSWSSRAAGSP